MVFDFDYTLADSSEGVVECANFALGGLGLSSATSEAICQTIGLSLSDTFVKLVGREDVAQSKEFARLFVKRADEVMAALTVLYASVPRTVQRLRKNGLKLGIVSTKYRHRIEGILRRENLLEAFGAIIGGEDVARHKPDPAGLQRAGERLNSVPAQMLYVGDSVVDAETARRGGVAFAAVLSGVTSREVFCRYPVARIANDLTELADWLVNG